jgi:hypothetical protein
MCPTVRFNATPQVSPLQLCNSMEQNPSEEANSFSARQEIPRILWNLKLNYCVHKISPLVPTLSQINPITHSHPIYLTSKLILSFHLWVGLPDDPFLSDFPTKTMYAFPFHQRTFRMPLPLYCP